MNPAFLNNLMAKKAMAQQAHSSGVCISSLPGPHTDENDRSSLYKVLVIPTGMSTTNLGHLREIPGVTIADGISRDYAANDASFAKFAATVETLRPTVIVAGSRGTELVTRLFSDSGSSKSPYHGAVLLFGPVHLSALFDALRSRKNRLVIVHGTKDQNEKIESVRGLVAGRSRTTRLVEATTKGHDMSFDENDGKRTMRRVIRYVDAE